VPSEWQKQSFIASGVDATKLVVVPEVGWLMMLVLLLYWIRALPDRPVGSHTRLVGMQR
jgi:hypothetical protein